MVYVILSERRCRYYRMNIGIIGFGAMGKTHLYALDNLKYFYDLPSSFDVKATAVCTSNIKTALAAKEKYGFLSASADEDDIILSNDIDAVCICTPNVYHFDTVKKAIENGKHVYCEKPLCVSYSQASELAALAERRGVANTVVFNNRFLAPIMRAKQLISDGRLGDIVSFRCAYYHSSCTDPLRPAGWKQNKDICGGGVLFDLGSHAIDLIYHLCGSVKNISGRAQIAYPSRCGSNGESWSTNAEEAFYATAELECGAVGTIEANKLAFGTNDDLELDIFGSRGALRFRLMEPNWLYYYDGSRAGGVLGGDGGFTRIECVGRYPAPGGVFPGVKAPAGWLRGHIGSMYNFISGVKNDIMPTPNFSDAAHVQRVIDAAYLSAERGGAIVDVDSVTEASL